ncbi:MAG: acetolactate decarboxylase [Burkholderiaceae bacterium]|nr:acetolactate decarboxylase [Burkholderiaceae bacterium]
MKLLRLRPVHGLLTCLLLAGATWASGLPFSFVHHGNFQRMMHTGDTAGQVALSALPQQPGTWGLGAAAGLEGEIVQVDGRLLVSPGSDATGRVRAPRVDEQAVLFAGARVQEWRDIAVPRNMDAAAFEAFVQEQAKGLGLPADQPFVFRVEGRFPHLLWHVVTGEQGPGAGHGSHGSHGGGHANQRSDMRLFHQPGVSGQFIGVYSGAALEGAVSHPGERFHLHFADPDATVSGHVDRYSVAAGAVLKLPVR